MRSDFYSLPYAAQQAIRRGERDKYRAARADTDIEALEQRVSELEEALRQCRFELDYCQQQLAAHGQTGHPEDSVSRALRAATAALNREQNP